MLTRGSIALGIGLATAMLVGACELWMRATPSLGQRPFDASWTCGMRCAAAAVWLLAHAVLAGWTFPLLYRRRPAYIGAAFCSGGVGVLVGVAAAGLLLAGR